LDILAATEMLKMLLDKTKLGYKNVSIVRQPSLVLYSYDVTTGVVVELGEHFSIVPVIDEFVVDEAVQPLAFGAKQIRQELTKRIDLKNALGEQNDEIGKEILLRYIIEKVELIYFV
jgi:actin-related protein